jgi:hypothetical protein
MVADRGRNVMAETPAQLPVPDPALRRLERFVGAWNMEGHLVGTDDMMIKGETSFSWRPADSSWSNEAH